MAHLCKIGFIGGDLRQCLMVEELVAEGHNITIYGFTCYTGCKNPQKATSLKEVMEANDIIVGPIPFSKDKKTIYALEPQADLTIQDLESLLRDEHTLFGGSISDELTEYCYEHDISCYDFMQMDVISIGNAIATAEGTIAEAITRSDCNLHKSNCLVLGFGRCAKILADKLKGLSASVTIGARKEDALAYADAYGYHTMPLKELEHEVSQFQFIFNSIPSLILTEAVLKKTAPNVTIIDIASKPGGTDFDYCRLHNINASLCLALPGKYAPKTTATLLNDVLRSYL